MDITHFSIFHKKNPLFFEFFKIDCSSGVEEPGLRNEYSVEGALYLSLKNYIAEYTGYNYLQTLVIYTVLEFYLKHS